MGLFYKLWQIYCNRAAGAHTEMTKKFNISLRPLDR